MMSGLTDLLLIIALPFVVIGLNAIYEKRGNKIKFGNKKSPNTDSSLSDTVRVSLAFNGRTRQEGVVVIIENAGIKPVSLEAPIVLFRFLFFYKKFRLKSSIRQLYPFLLNAGCSCNISLNLSGFYSRIPKLQWFPLLTVKIKESSGHNIKPVSLFLKPAWLP